MNESDRILIGNLNQIVNQEPLKEFGGNMNISQGLGLIVFQNEILAKGMLRLLELHGVC